METSKLRRRHRSRWKVWKRSAAWAVLCALLMLLGALLTLIVVVVHSL